jgi:hypothetical protein
MSFNLKLNKVNFTCAPLLTESFNGTETIGYMCKSNTTIEGFYESNDLKATFFVNCNYQGQSFSLGVGNHDIGQMGIPNDSLSSIRIPSGLKVTIFENAGFVGRRIAMTVDEPCLANRVKNGLNFNDQTSSIKIERI